MERCSSKKCRIISRSPRVSNTSFNSKRSVSKYSLSFFLNDKFSFRLSNLEETKLSSDSTLLTARDASDSFSSLDLLTSLAMALACSQFLNCEWAASRFTLASSRFLLVNEISAFKSSNLFSCFNRSAASDKFSSAMQQYPSHLHKFPSFDTNFCPALSNFCSRGPSAELTSPIVESLLSKTRGAVTF